ncbi:ABC transporter permease [Paenibacillus sp. YN15]|uniref:ABC transporter permease n=1 Tax=Paenibacillus sp. YN15 TaxID=1742774 RepID=UPI000DCD61B3|nr:ABC transporter permease [Paenibacillus sp. YN15]RAV02364.1 ABC transporter permease [Paenibacillus sp. YN15]
MKESSEPLSLTRRVWEEYRAAQQKRNRLVRLTQLLILLGAFGLWELAGRLKWIDVLLFSYPSKIFTLLYEQISTGEMLPHIGATVWETFVGFVLGTVAGTGLAVLIWWSPFLERVLDPYIVVLNSLPKVALGPLFIVGLGPGYTSIIGMTLAITVIITTLVVYSSFKEVDVNYLRVIRVFGGGKTQIFRKAIFPASIPTIVSTLKVNVGLAWVGVIVGEFLVSKEGLGYLIIYGFQVFNFTLVIASLLVIAVVAALMYQAVAWLENRLNNRW